MIYVTNSFILMIHQKLILRMCVVVVIVIGNLSQLLQPYAIKVRLFIAKSTETLEN